MLIRPSELRYTQNSIANHFRNGKSLEDSLWRLLRNINEVNSRIDNMPKMEIMNHGGHYYVVGGNRRLYLLQKLESAGIITEVNVDLVTFDPPRFNKRHTTKCEGQSIRVRHSPNMDGRISHVIAKYQQKKAGFPVSDDDSDDDAIGASANSLHVSSFLYDSDDGIDDSDSSYDNWEYDSD